jgi:ubiquinone/menaquinone biosynthesis C-methylase UbiE
VRGGIPLAAEQFDILLRLVRSAHPGLRRFLDLGCGDGVLGEALLESHPLARGVFLDFSEQMLQAARTRIEGAGWRGHRYLLADYGDRGWARLPELAESFEVIVSGFSIHHQQDERKREIYGEIRELLEPGGLFLNLEHVASRSAWGTALFDDYFIDSLFAYHSRLGSGKSRPEVAETYVHRADKSANILAPVEVQCDWLRELGYEEVDCYFKTFELALFGGRRPMSGKGREPLEAETLSRSSRVPVAGGSGGT